MQSEPQNLSYKTQFYICIFQFFFIPWPFAAMGEAKFKIAYSLLYRQTAKNLLVSHQLYEQPTFVVFE